jgi:diguanylate cyclase (GGDEF)-like protein
MLVTDPSIYAFTALAIGALLGLRFKRLRVVWAALALAATLWALSQPHPRMALAAILWLPGALALMALSKERGLFTPAGLGKGVALLIPVLLFWFFQDDASSWRWLTRDFLPPSLQRTGALNHAQASAWGLGGAIVLAGLVWRRTPLSHGFALAFAAAGVGFFFGGDDATKGLTAAGLILILALLQESYSMAFIDELTHLPGRRALNEELLRMGRHYTIAMLDVDHFKKFNDRYGHDVGDLVLERVARRMRRVKGGGRAFRYGGEEFTIVFPGRSVDQVKKHLEAVRRDIQRSRVSIPSRLKPKRKGKRKGKRTRNARTVSVTISIGAAQRSDQRRSPEEVLTAADKALYRAKRKGRNQVQCTR